MKPIRLKWKPFTATKAHKVIQRALKRFGYKLVVKFDEKGSATDAYVISRQGN